MFWAYLHPWSKVDTLSWCKQSNIIGKRRSNIHGFVICSDQGPLHVELFLLWLDNERVCIGTCRDVTSMVVTGWENHWLSFNLYTLSVHIPTCDITFTTECCTAIVHLTLVDQDATNITFYLTVPCSYSNAFDALCTHINVSYIISGSVRNTQNKNKHHLFNTNLRQQSDESNRACTKWCRWFRSPQIQTARPSAMWAHCPS